MTTDREKAHRALLEETRAADPGVVTRAVRNCTEHLRERAWEPSLFDALVARLVELAGHDNERPRQAVAEALSYLPDDAYALLQPKLAEDVNLYVRGAALAAPAKRATRKRDDARRDEDDEDARASAYYAKLGSAERRIAGWIAELHTEYYVRREHHEIDNVCVRIDHTMRKLEAIAGGEVGGYVERLREDFVQMRRIHAEARKNARTMEPSFGMVSLRAIVKAEAEDLPIRYPDRKDRVHVDIDGVDGKIELTADAGSLRDAFGNILRNAVEAYEALGEERPIHVAVSARLSGTDAIISFADRGPGMNEEQMARAFVPFGSTKRGGTGFGLYNARKVARQIHGGDLQIASTPGAGTIVTMTLPLRQETTKRKRSRR
jgi:signal transduction histidine kinase